LKNASPLIGSRIGVLIEIKRKEKTIISKRGIAKIVGVDTNSVQTWRTLYYTTGVEGIKKTQ